MPSTRLYTLLGLVAGMSVLLWAQVTLISHLTKRAKSTISPASISPLFSGTIGSQANAQPSSGPAPSTLPGSLPALPAEWPYPLDPLGVPSGPTQPSSGAPGGSSPSPSSVPPAASPTAPKSAPYRKEVWTPAPLPQLPKDIRLGTDQGARDGWR